MMAVCDNGAEVEAEDDEAVIRFEMSEESARREPMKFILMRVIARVKHW
jgi:hypothetical protein